MVLLMVALSIIGLKHTAQVNSLMKHIVEENNIKIEMAQIMQNALQERAVSMHSIAVLQDIFLKDDEFMYFNKVGGEYYQARKKLESLAVTNEEKGILEKIRHLTKITQPDVQNAVELGLRNSTPAIVEKIRQTIIPKQRLIAEEVKKLVILQNIQATQALNAAQFSYINVRNLMLFLGVFAALLGLVIAFIVIRHVTKQATQLEHQALHDELTGLPNRGLFQDRLKRSVFRGQREGIPFTVMLLDLDKFKIINDSFGHNIGDLLLQEVARRLNSVVRNMDTVARLGGDEFVIILESLPYDRVIRMADKIIAEIKKPFLLNGQELHVGISIGISSYPEHGQDCTTLINRADLAMYDAKRNNQVYKYYDESLKQEVTV